MRKASASNSHRRRRASVVRPLLAAVALCTGSAKLALAAEKCNHTHLVWDASHSGVGIPSSCSDLSLVDEGVGDAGAVAIALQLSSGQAPQLRTLDLYENRVGDAGAKALADALRSSGGAGLRELYLWGNHVGNEGARALAQALESNAKLDALVLWNNKVGDAGADDFLRALDTNMQISKLYLTGNKVSKAKMALLKAKLSHDAVALRKAKAAAQGDDCEVDEWPPWSDCEGGCGGGGFQHRERAVRVPPSGNGRKCPSLEEVRPCETPPCPKDPLTDFMKDCGLADPQGTADLAKDTLGAANPADLFELDADDVGQLGLKVAQRKRLVRCLCDASGDAAPCCDVHRQTGRHHSSVDDIMALAETVRRGDALATEGLDCDGALGLYAEALAMAAAMGAHNFFGEVSYKVFLVKARCRGARTPTRADAEACGARGVELLANEWVVEDFRRGVAHGWSQTKHDAALSASGAGHGAAAAAVTSSALLLGQKPKAAASASAEDLRVPGIAVPGHAEAGLGLAAEAALGGLHWSTWYELFGTTADGCHRAAVDKAWALLMLRYNADQAYRHPWSADCANLASIVVSAGRELLFEMTPCGARSGQHGDEM